jgi:hypothetical protein
MTARLVTYLETLTEWRPYVVHEQGRRSAADSDGCWNLFVVDGSMCWVSAVDEEADAIRWVATGELP